MKHFKLILVALVAVSSLGASAFDWKQLGSALSSGSLGSVINNVIIFLFTIFLYWILRS